MTQFLSQNGDAQDCIEHCMKCYEVCTRTLAAGLEINEDQDFITALQLCSQAAQLAAQSLLLDSAFYPKTCALAAELCEAVALICENFDEEEMRRCGHVCEETARSCQKMATHSVPQKSLPVHDRLEHS